MALAADIRTLRDCTLAELNAVHDYYTETIFAWKVVKDVVDGGTVFTVRNLSTGTVTAQNELVDKSRKYVSVHIAEATFQQFLGLFESFFFDLLRLWLLAYPRNLLARQVDFRTVLESPDKDAIALHVINRALNDVLYDRPANWFVYLEETLKIGCPADDEIARIAEAKATRDALVHNRGVAGKYYESKAGRLARCKEGDRVEVTDDYHRGVWDLLRKSSPMCATRPRPKCRDRVALFSPPPNPNVF